MFTYKLREDHSIIIFTMGTAFNHLRINWKAITMQVRRETKNGLPRSRYPNTLAEEKLNI